MSHVPQLRIPATYMRGGTSKGVFFRLQDLPIEAQTPGAARDALLMRVIGSPDPYGKHTDGMGGATSSTSKCVIIAPASVPDHDVDYLYGQVSIDSAFVDWSGNCGNLSTAVGPFAIASGFVPADRIAQDGTVCVRVWQANIGKTILVHVPVSNGQVQETGDFELDGVTFPAAEIVLEFIDPSDDGESGGQMFPTGNQVDDLDVPGVGTFKATMITAGIPTVFVNAADLAASAIDVNVRAMSMGKLHHAMMGTASVAIATAAAVPGTLVNLAAGGGSRERICFGHPSGTLSVGASVQQVDDRWTVTRAVMSRSARVLMEGWVRVPSNSDS